jgi:hypothetical protein
LVINSTGGNALADPAFAQSNEVHDVEQRLLLECPQPILAVKPDDC